MPLSPVKGFRAAIGSCAALLVSAVATAAAAATSVTVFPQAPLPAAAEYLPAFYGFIHAHTSYSIDYKGSGGETPADAFAFARTTGGLDWMAVSDHSESYLNDDHWIDTATAAEAATQEGSFVAFRAFEYSNATQGHLCVVNTEDWTSWLKDGSIASFFDWLSNYPAAVATFNHPGSYDIFNNEFYHFQYRTDVAPMVVGLEMLNKDSTFDTRDAGYEGKISYMDEAIQKGWWLASVSGEDSHRADWGTMTDGRTGLLAPALTKAELLSAFRERRFFTTEDKNAYISFQHGGVEMGGAVTVAADSTFDVYFSDPDGEGWNRLEVYRNGVVAASEALDNAGSGTAQVSVPLPDATDYYYVRVRQSDGERIQSAPIWLTKSATGTVATF